MAMFISNHVHEISLYVLMSRVVESLQLAAGSVLPCSVRCRRLLRETILTCEELMLPVESLLWRALSVIGTDLH